MEVSYLASRQNKVLVPFSDDVDELNFRLKGVNQCGRQLLGK
jgi:synaptosomal-associated protein 25